MNVAGGLRVSRLVCKCMSICRQSSTACDNVRPSLTLFTKSGECSLCDEMKEAIEPYKYAVSFLN